MATASISMSEPKPDLAQRPSSFKLTLQTTLCSVVAGGFFGALLYNIFPRKIPQKGFTEGCRWGAITGVTLHTIATIKSLEKKKRKLTKIQSKRTLNALTESPKGTPDLQKDSVSVSGVSPPAAAAMQQALVPSNEEIEKLMRQYLTQNNLLSSNMLTVMQVQLNPRADPREKYQISVKHPDECRKFNEIWWRVASPDLVKKFEKQTELDDLSLPAKQVMIYLVDTAKAVDKVNTPKNTALLTTSVSVMYIGFVMLNLVKIS